MTGQLVVVGAGGHGRETVEAARRAGFDVVGVVSEHQPDAGVMQRLGVVWLGTVDALAGMDVPCVVGIGLPELRAGVVAELVARGQRFATVIDPTATLGVDVRLGDGVIVQAGAHLTTNVAVGDHTHIGVGSIIGYDVTLGECVTLSQGVVVGGLVNVTHCAFIGAGATIAPNIHIGHSAIVAARAMVVRDVPSEATVKGVAAH